MTEYGTLVMSTLIIVVILLRWSIYTYYIRKSIVELTEEVMHGNVPLHLTIYNNTMELVELYGYRLTNTDTYYRLYDDEGKLLRKGMLTEIYMVMYNKKNLNNLH